MQNICPSARRVVVFVLLLLAAVLHASAAGTIGLSVLTMNNPFFK